MAGRQGATTLEERSALPPRVAGSLPANYTFNFKGSVGTGAVNIGFGEAGVSSLSLLPRGAETAP